MPKFSTRNILVSIKGKGLERIYKNFHIRVTASKTMSSNPNQANIEIYNLNQDSRQQLFNNVYDENKNKKGNKAKVYLGGTLFFAGTLINVNNVYDNKAAEWKTYLFCGNGFRALHQQTNRRFNKGTNKATIIEELTQELKDTGAIVETSMRGLTDCIENRSLLKAIFLNGSIMDNLTNLLTQCFGADDTQVYQDGEVLHLTVGKTPIKVDKLLINKGLTQPPTLTEQGVNCQTTINPLLKISSLFEIQAKSFNTAFGNLTVHKQSKGRISGSGTYFITEVKHSFDNFSSDIATTEIIGLRRS